MRTAATHPKQRFQSSRWSTTFVSRGHGRSSWLRRWWGWSSSLLPRQQVSRLSVRLLDVRAALSLDVNKLPKGATKLTFCVGDRCRRVGLDKKAKPKIACNGGSSARVSVLARDAQNGKVAHLSRKIPLTMEQPNGPDCPPTCYVGQVRLDGKKLVLIP
jgi:hypothetical protein